jgi:hypothetical protein
MPTLATRKPKTRLRLRRTSPKSTNKRTRGPSFGEWARSVAGMMKDGPPDLSMREGFGP